MQQIYYQSKKRIFNDRIKINLKLEKAEKCSWSHKILILPCSLFKTLKFSRLVFAVKMLS